MKHIKALKYFLLYSALLLSFYAYSASTGWVWLTGTSTEREAGEHGPHHTGGHYRTYHK